MANEQNLKPFTSDNQPSGEKKSRKGIPNRATILKKWLKVKTEVENPATEEKVKGTVEDEIALALIKEAKKGNVKAIIEIQDSIHGKIKNETDITSGGEAIAKPIADAINSFEKALLKIYDHEGADK